MHAQRKDMRPCRYGTDRESLADRSDLPAAGELRQHRYRCVDLDKTPRLGLIEAV